LPSGSTDLEPYGSPAHSAWLDVDWAAHRHTVTVDGTRVNYVRMGAGPAVLLIHGLAGSWRNWLENIPDIARDHTAIAVDLPGFGESESPRGEVTISGYAAFIGSFLEEIGVQEAALVGSSMGGLIAAAVAAGAPGRARSLVLVSAAAPGTRAAPGQEVGRSGPLQTLAAAAARRSGLLLRSATVRRVALGRLMRHPDRISRRLVGQLAAGVARPASIAARHATENNDIGTRLGDIEAQTLLVWGAEDRVVPPRVASHYEAAIANSRLVVMPDTGHAPMIERPAFFNRVLHQFFSAT
jgi:pimeloyl-ACP methyl ester carboxylesterase